MCEVVRKTFSETFPQIEESIRKCDFIAIDTEFTGLIVDEQDKSSLFDDGAARYLKLRKTIQQITITQFGLSLFKKDKTENRYVAESYNIYLYPRSWGPLDQRFVCQASSLEFACQYNFDFNKFIYEGVSYLNEEEESRLMQHIESRAMFTGLERNVDEDSLQKVCSLVADWFVKSEAGETLTIEKDEQQKIWRYVLSMELRNRFPEIWTDINKEKGTIEVWRVGLGERQKLEKETAVKQQQQDDQLVEDLVGFTRVFRVMTQCKKPLIAHNCLMDMMLLYQKFYKPLPASYTQFKSDLHALFPKIFDTKHISARIRRSMEEKNILQSTGLGYLFADFNSDRGRDAVIHSPAVVHSQHCKQYEAVIHSLAVVHSQHCKQYEDSERPHEAGYDAFMSGFVFLKLAHVIAFRNTKSSEVVPCVFARYVCELSDFMNRVNMMRGSVMHINLAGEDRKSVRPDLLYVSARAFKQRLDVNQLAKWFSAYGSVDVQLGNHRRALVATSNHSCAKDILAAFKNNRLIYVTKYSVWRHSPMVRGLLWSSVLISGGLCALVLFSKEKKVG